MGGESALTYGAIGTGLLIFAAIFGIVWAVIDSRAKGRAEKERNYQEDKRHIYSAIDKAEKDASHKVSGVYKTLDELEKEYKELLEAHSTLQGEFNLLKALVMKDSA